MADRMDVRDAERADALERIAALYRRGVDEMLDAGASGEVLKLVE